MATETQTTPSQPFPPHFTVFTRVVNIPLISESLAAIHATLLNNAYTRLPYTTAQQWGTAASRAAEPFQVRLAPVIVRADGLANKAFDVVESRFPYPFRAPSGEIYSELRQRGEQAYGAANKTIDDRIRQPAYGIATGIDQRFTPVVDSFAYVVKTVNGKMSDSAPALPDDSDGKEKYQYQRAYRLSRNLKDTIYGYTSEQLKQIHDHNAIVQRASSAAHNISTSLSNSYGAASARIHTLSDAMLSELHNLQNSAAALPAQAQASLNGLSERLGPVINQIKEVLKSEAPMSEKLNKLREAVEQQVQPLLAGATAKVHNAMNAVRRQTSNSESKVEAQTDTQTDAPPSGEAQ